MAATRDELIARLTVDRYDVVLSDYRLPGWTAMDALALLRQHGHDTPLIVVTGTLDDEQAVQCLSQGAADYVFKHRLARLPTAVRRVLAERGLRDGQRASEERYRMLFDSTPLPMWVYDRETHSFLAVNEAAVRHYGYGRADFLAMRIEDLRPPEDVPALHRQIDSMSAGHHSGTWRHRKKDGTLIAVEINGHDMAWGGRPAALVVAHDITERTRSEQAFAERTSVAELGTEIGFALTRGRTQPEILQGCCEALVRNLDAAFARIWTLNEPERMLELQASAGLYTQLDGTDSRIVVGEGNIGLIASERQPRVTNAVLDDLGRDQDERPKGEDMASFVGYPLLVQDRLVGVVAIFSRQPVTEFVRDALATVADSIAVAIERKRAEEALRLSEQRMRSLFETMNLIVVGLDAAGHVEYANPFLLALTGYSRDEMVDQDWVERFLPVAQRQAMHGVFHELLEQDLHSHYQNPILTKAGKERTISWHNTRVTDAQGQGIGTISVGEDVTEHLQLEQQFRQAQKMEAVGRLAGGVAHDFNNLLTVILGSASWCSKRCEPDAPQRAGHRRDPARRDERAAALTRQLLAFSRQQVLAPRVLDLNELVAEHGEAAAATHRRGHRCCATAPHRTARRASRRIPGSSSRSSSIWRSTPATPCRAAASSPSRPRNVELDAGVLRTAHLGVATPGAYVHARGHRHRHRHGRGRPRATSSSRSSPPRSRAREPGSACRPCTASSSRAAATSGCTASRATAPTFKIYLPRSRRCR